MLKMGWFGVWRPGSSPQSRDITSQLSAAGWRNDWTPETAVGDGAERCHWTIVVFYALNIYTENKKKRKENPVVTNTVHKASLKITRNRAIRSSPYKFLLAFHSNYVPILHRFYRATICWCGMCCRVSIRMSVHPSITSRYCMKTAKRRMTQTRMYDSPGTLIFWGQRSWRNSNGGAK